MKYGTPLWMDPRYDRNHKREPAERFLMVGSVYRISKYLAAVKYRFKHGIIGADLQQRGSDRT